VNTTINAHPAYTLLSAVLVTVNNGNLANMANSLTHFAKLKTKCLIFTDISIKFAKLNAIKLIALWFHQTFVINDIINFRPNIP